MYSNSCGRLILKDELLRTLEIYKTPSQSLWRALELAKLKEVKAACRFEPPVLEIGCGDGVFSSLVFDRIDDGIDINPRAIAHCGGTQSVHERVHLMDARSMQFPSESYRTVFANCVLEHIPDLGHVLEESCRVLGQGGKLVATVPLREMNKHLLLRTAWYADLRRRQLCHRNLLTIPEWRSALELAGFSSIGVYPYLFAANCYRWDLLDLPICIGYRRYTVSALLRLIGRTLPHLVRRSLRQRIADCLLPRAGEPSDQTPCATLLLARK